jgi:hypothetical protein
MMKIADSMRPLCPSSVTTAEVRAALNFVIPSVPDFLFVELERAACAVFCKENRMEFATPPTLTGNPGQLRDLQFYLNPQPILAQSKSTEESWPGPRQSESKWVRRVRASVRIGGENVKGFQPPRAMLESSGVDRKLPTVARVRFPGGCSWRRRLRVRVRSRCRRSPYRPRNRRSRRSGLR